MQKKPSDLQLTLTNEGYLINQSDWREEVAQFLANHENITLAPDHWTVIKYLRDFYQQFQLFPSQRVMLAFLAKQWGKEKATSLYLLELFPKGPIKQASKIAGLPKPLKCL